MDHAKTSNKAGDEQNDDSVSKDWIDCKLCASVLCKDIYISFDIWSTFMWAFSRFTQSYPTAFCLKLFVPGDDVIECEIYCQCCARSCISDTQWSIFVERLTVGE